MRHGIFFIVSLRKVQNIKSQSISPRKSNQLRDMSCLIKKNALSPCDGLCESSVCIVYAAGGCTKDCLKVDGNSCAYQCVESEKSDGMWSLSLNTSIPNEQMISILNISSNISVLCVFFYVSYYYVEY